MQCVHVNVVANNTICVCTRGGQIMLKILPIMLCSGAQKTTYYASHYAQIVLDCNERIYDNDDYNERNNDR